VSEPRYLALRFLLEVEQGRHADELTLISAFGRLARADRGLARELVYGCLRQLRLLDYTLAQHSTGCCAWEPTRLPSCGFRITLPWTPRSDSAADLDSVPPPALSTQYFGTSFENRFRRPMVPMPGHFRFDTAIPNGW